MLFSAQFSGEYKHCFLKWRWRGLTESADAEAAAANEY
jgi:hypothetical protein